MKEKNQGYCILQFFLNIVYCQKGGVMYEHFDPEGGMNEIHEIPYQGADEEEKNLPLQEEKEDILKTGGE